MNAHIALWLLLAALCAIAGCDHTDELALDHMHCVCRGAVCYCAEEARE